MTVRYEEIVSRRGAREGVEGGAHGGRVADAYTAPKMHAPTHGLK